jgi:hypothetical protein
MKAAIELLRRGEVTVTDLATLSSEQLEIMKANLSDVDGMFSGIMDVFTTGAERTEQAIAKLNEALSFIQTPDLQRKASGGYISGPGGPKDDLIPAMLSNGEFVLQASAVKKFGKGFLTALNAGRLQGFSEGTPDPRYLQLLAYQKSYTSEIQNADARIATAERASLGTNVVEQYREVKATAKSGLQEAQKQLALFDKNGVLKVTELEALQAGLGTGLGGKGSKASSSVTFKTPFLSNKANCF